jgi:nucleotide-binding universal stress UspA family protein
MTAAITAKAINSGVTEPTTPVSIGSAHAGSAVAQKKGRPRPVPRPGSNVQAAEIVARRLLRHCEGMHMFTTIVVGTDGSDTATVAVDKAIELARQSGAAVHIVHSYPSVVGVVADPIGGAGAAEMSNAVLSEASESLLAETAQRADGLAVRTHSLRDAPAEAVVRVADEVNADLIVVGSKGMHRRIIGSVPNSVAHRAPCSVMIVKTT